jgi:hypothetical protein
MDRRLVHEVPALDHRLFQAQSLSTAAAHVMGPSVNPPLAEDGGTRQEPSGEPGPLGGETCFPGTESRGT